MFWIRVLERLQNSRSESDSVPSPFHFERLEPRILLSADFLPGFSDHDSDDRDQHQAYSPDLQPLLSFLSSPLDKHTVKDSLSLLPEPLQLDSLEDTYGAELKQHQTSASLIDDLAFLLAPEPEDADSRFEIIIVDSATPDYQQLLDNLQTGSDNTLYQVYILDSDSDGLEQISDILQEQQDVDAVHIISHGDDGKVKLGNTWLDSSNLDEYAELIMGWQQTFDQDADLLIYGCNLATTAEGVNLVQRLGQLTGADVAASDDLTGAESLGADWELEVASGPIESDLPFSAEVQENWNHVLVPPVMADAGGTLDYTDGDGARVIDSTLTITDVDGTNIESATISITAGLVNTEDLLAFTDTVNITGSYVAATGVLTLTGTDTLANYEAALESITYENSSDEPDTGNRTVTWVVNDGDTNSAGVTSTITVAAINDEPTLTTTGSNPDIGGGDGPSGLFSGTSISTVESGQTITGLTITVKGVVPPDNSFEKLTIDGTVITLDQGQTGATTNFTSYSVSRSGSTVTFVLSGGTVTPATMETVLDSAAYQHDDPTPGGSSREVEITQLVDDGGTANGGDNTNDLSGQTSVASLVGINAAVVTGAGETLAYTEDDGAREIDTTLTITDGDDTELVSATISITGGLVSSEDVLAFTDTANITGIFNATTGVLTLSGVDTLANYEAALESITYTNTNTDNPDTGNRTVTWVVNDGDSNSMGVTSTVTVAALNDAPVLGNTSLTLNEGETVTVTTAMLSATDVDNTDSDLTFTVSNVTGGHFALSADTATPITSFTQAQVTGSTVVFVDNGDENAPLFHVDVSDGSVSAGAVAGTVNFTNQNDAPVLGNTSLTLNEGETVTVTTAMLSATDVDNTDSDLTFTVSNVTGGHFALSADTATPITSFTQAQITGSTVVFVDDGDENAPLFDVDVSDGSASAGAVAGTVNFTNQNDAPVLGNTSLTLNEGETITVTNAMLSATDVDNADPGLTFTVSNVTGGHFALSADTATPITSFTQAQITGSTVVFVDDGDENAPLFDVAVGDGSTSDGPVAGTVNFTNQNDPATVDLDTGTGGNNYAFNFNQGDAATSIVAAVYIDDVDDTTLVNVTLDTGGILDGVAEELTIGDLAFALNAADFNNAAVTIGGNIYTVDWVNATGVATITLNSGEMTIVQAETVMQATQYQHTDTVNPTGGNRIIDVMVNDGNVDSAVATTIITVVPANAPTVDLDTGTGGNNYAFNFTEDDARTTIVGTVSVADANDSTLVNVTLDTGSVLDGAAEELTIGDLTFALDAADFNNTAVTIGGNTYTVDWVNATGVATVDLNSGEMTIAQAESVLLATKYQHTDTSNPTAGDRTIDVWVNDGDGDSAVATTIISVAAVNDAPVLGNTSLTLNEGETVTVTTAMLSATDVDNADPGLTFTVSNVTGGHFALSADTATPITSFTQAQITGSTVVFVDDGDENAPLFDVDVSDGGASAGAVAGTVNFTNQNDAPVLGNTSLTLNEGETVTVTTAMLSATDIDNADPGLTFTVSNVTGGHFALSADTATPITSFTQAQITGSTVVFVDDGDENAPLFDVDVSDGSASAGAVAGTVNFTNQNDAPALGNTSLTLNEGQTVTVTTAMLSATDIDNADPGLTFTVSNVTGGHFALSADTATPITSFTQAQITGSTVVFVDDGDDNAPLFDVDVSDGIANAGQIAGTVNFTNQNDAPVLGNTSLTLNEGQTVTVTTAMLSATDVDNADSGLTFTVSNVTGGHFALSADTATPITSFTQAQITGSTVVFVDDGDENTPLFDVDVSDGSASAGTVTGTVNFTSQNDAPAGLPIITGTVSEDQMLTADTSGITDADGLGAFNYQWLRDGVDISGETASTYTLSDADVGAAITVQVSYTDAGGTVESATSAATAPVSNINDAPNALGEQLTVDEDSLINEDAANGVLVNDTDPDPGDALRVIRISNGVDSGDPGVGIAGSAGGSFVINGDGSYSFDPMNDFQDLADSEQRTTQVSYTVADNQGAEASVNLTVIVTGMNDASMLVEDIAQTDEDTVIANATEASVLANDTDLDGSDQLQVTSISNGTDVAAAGQSIAGDQGGEFVIQADGTFSFDPGTDFQALAADETRPTQVSYTVSDGQGGSATTSLTVVVAGLSSTPLDTPDLDINPDDSSDDETENPVSDETEDPIPEDVDDESNDEPEETEGEEGAGTEDLSDGDESGSEDEPEVSDTPVSGDFLFSDVGTSEISIDAPETTISFGVFDFLDEDDDDESEVRETTTVDRMRSEYSSFSDPSTLMGSQSFLRGLDSVRDEVAIEIQAEQMVVGGGFALTTGLSVGYVVWLARSGILLSSLLTSLPAWQFMDPLPVLASMQGGIDDDTDDDSLESLVDGETNEPELNIELAGEVEAPGGGE